MIRKHLNIFPIKVCPPNLKCKHHHYHLQIVSWIILLVFPQLSKCIRDHMFLLHQDAAEPIFDASTQHMPLQDEAVLGMVYSSVAPSNLQSSSHIPLFSHSIFHLYSSSCGCYNICFSNSYTSRFDGATRCSVCSVHRRKYPPTVQPRRFMHH